MKRILCLKYFAIILILCGCNSNDNEFPEEEFYMNVINSNGTEIGFELVENTREVYFPSNDTVQAAYSFQFANQEYSYEVIFNIILTTKEFVGDTDQLLTFLESKSWEPLTDLSKMHEFSSLIHTTETNTYIDVFQQQTDSGVEFYNGFNESSSTFNLDNYSLSELDGQKIVIVEGYFSRALYNTRNKMDSIISIANYRAYLTADFF